MLNIVNIFAGAMGCFCLFNLANRRKGQLRTKINSHAASTKVILLSLSVVVLFSGPLFNTLVQVFLFYNPRQGINVSLLNKLFISNI